MGQFETSQSPTFSKTNDDNDVWSDDDENNQIALNENAMEFNDDDDDEEDEDQYLNKTSVKVGFQ